MRLEDVFSFHIVYIFVIIVLHYCQYFFWRQLEMKPFPSTTDCFKAAYSVTFDLLILELTFLFFKNTVK